MNARACRNWADFRTVLLYEAGFNLKEVGRMSGGISRQAVHQRLTRLGVVCRAKGLKGPRAGPRSWQQQIAQRLVDMGLTLREAGDLLGISVLNGGSVKGTRTRGGMGKRAEFRLFIVEEAWHERRSLILGAAVCDGANMADINAISGMKYRYNNLGPFTVRLRGPVPDLPIMRRGKMVPMADLEADS